MGPIFSHSRIASFENCPKQFEFRYVQKIQSETESIEAFVGKRVHEVLERLYLFAGRGMLPGIEKVVDRYHKLWEDAYDAERVRIVREGATLGFYRALGERCVRGYYLRHYPFDDGETLGLEKRVLFPLDEGGQYRMQGIIDRISRARDGTIEVHDYKTGARVPTQRALDEDRQLALYQIGLAREFGDSTRFRLVWHYVAKDVTRVSLRTREELDLLRETTIARIDEIQTTTAFAVRKSALCGWCEYRSICPAFAGERAAASQPEAEPQPQAERGAGARASTEIASVDADGADGGTAMPGTGGAPGADSESARSAAAAGASTADAAQLRLL
jgi:putative RecB family exonuclease